MQTKIRSFDILPVNLLLMAVGLADLFSTMLWLHTGQIIEVNPIMAALLRGGEWLFFSTKLGTLVAYLGVMEWYRRYRNPVFARTVGMITLFSYLGIYAVSFCCVNWNFINRAL